MCCPIWVPSNYLLFGVNAYVSRPEEPFGPAPIVKSLRTVLFAVSHGDGKYLSGLTVIVLFSIAALIHV